MQTASVIEGIAEPVRLGEYGVSGTAFVSDVPFLLPVLWVIAAGLGLALWLFLARSLLPRGDTMQGPERIAQLYGYSVCLIAIIVILASVNAMVNQAFRLAYPLASSVVIGWGGQPALGSFEAYEATRHPGVITPPGFVQARSGMEPTAEELRRTYEALRADRVAYVRYDAGRALTGSALLLLLATGLLLWHWRWVRTLQHPSGTAPANAAA
jgi:hypothetical protein